MNRFIVLFYIIFSAIIFCSADDYNVWLGESVHVQCPVPNNKISNSVVVSQNFSWKSVDGIDYQMDGGARLANLTISKFFLDTRTVTCTVTWTEQTHTSFSTQSFGPYTQVYRYNFSYHKVKAEPNQSTYTLTVGSSQEIGYTLTNQPSNPAAVVSFKTSDPNIATVNNAGIITAINPGECELLISTNYGIESTAHIIVNAVQPTSISLNVSDLTLSINETFQLILMSQPTNSIISDIKYESENPDVASVDNTGKITALSAGKTTIKALVNNISAFCVVNVKNVIPEEIILSSYNVNLSVGDIYDLNPQLRPEGSPVTNFLYYIENPKIGIIDDFGKITALNVGSTKIHIYAHNLETLAILSVREPDENKTTIHNYSLVNIDDQLVVYPLHDITMISSSGGKNIEGMSYDDSWSILFSKTNDTNDMSDNLVLSDLVDNEVVIFHKYNNDIKTKDLSTGITEVFEDSFVISSIDGLLRISNIQNIYSIRLYDLSGKKIYNLENPPSDISINLHQGEIYILEYRTSNCTKAFKIIL